MRDQVERIPPTPETQAQFKRKGLGTIEVLLNKGRLLPEHITAADEIEWVFIGVTGALYAKGNIREPIDGSRTNTMPESLAIAHRDRFKPWADWMKKNKTPPIVSVCLDVIVEGKTACEIDRYRRWRKGKAVDYLIEGLDQYAKMAGWLRCG